MTSLSKRSTATLASLDKPWKFAASTTFDPVTNPNGLISFSTAENSLVLEEIADFVNAKLSIGPAQLGYKFSTGGGPRFPEALAVHLNEYLDPVEPIKPDHIKTTSSCTALHDILSWALADEGEGILLSQPFYGRFELDFFNRSKVNVVYVDTDAETCFDVDVVDKYEKALLRSNAAGVQVRAIMIINPHNPLGKCYPRDTIIGLMKLCQKYNIHLISDEVYACSVFDSGEPDTVPFTSVLSIDSKHLIDENLVHVEYGFAKDFASGGLRIGAIISRNQQVCKAISSITRFHNPSGASLAVACAILEDREWCRSYIDSMRRKIAGAYKHATSQLQQLGIEYLGGSNAGFFLWIDLSPYLPSDLGGEDNAEFALAKKLKDAGVFLHPREEHCSRPGWFRLVYTFDPLIVTEGLRRLGSVIHAQ